ncbi:MULTISPECIES: ectoine/hydroxyectoine ABC transporter substrate-binding protein EhuB [unclassified Mesorhizobium]|uniref:ectoine/hydroxyectoine ABC transporter substrate-binding protein EhuB n=1 Tax=unclassified Mesorhizobium TaxID=325217 RepID=UPI0003CF479D|nr:MULTISPECIES: ectoine/hydroxyectoine ABC transporter substrate-binding protein EhuB [unclassified Mesorhizobium]ESY44127.1 hypothetical protein X745_32125 [Mesorhizobium sp. LNJC374B00]ESY49744.1 hypothetical protein X744_32050 [Mesorhizobium sp. LNJC372A00]WJI80982.1 ectoine/hydroxyectoine ABC transporter substrate-binding protein EhuB [Mesorhizobium sp. C374B]WJI87522.1 ectoine/hydroxyectoine ABC transporter substrate-binding protein EhuB [Mesorhizobium sp. C372A]
MKKWPCIEGGNGFFRHVLLKGAVALSAAAVVAGSLAAPAAANSLLDKIKAGEPIRIGYSNDAPWAYSGDNNEPQGIGNTVVLAVLKKLGATKFEPVVTEWGSLIPGLQAGRFDLISDGMYVRPERCRNVLFTEPYAAVTDALVVPAGNPKGLTSLEDIRDKGATVVTGSAFASLKNARDAGISDEQIMQVPGYAEIIQAMKAGRVDAGVGDYLGLKKAIHNDEKLQLATSTSKPNQTGFPAVAFPLDDRASVDAFNAALKEYVGSAEMLTAVGNDGYDKSLLPGDAKTADLCKG